MRQTKILLRDLIQPVSSLNFQSRIGIHNFTLNPITLIEFLSTVGEFEALVKKEPTLLELKGPIFVVGDLHGQLIDLYQILGRCGLPPQNSIPISWRFG